MSLLNTNLIPKPDEIRFRKAVLGIRFFLGDVIIEETLIKPTPKISI